MSTHCPVERQKERGSSAEVMVTHEVTHSLRALIWCLACLRSCIHFQTRQSMPSSQESQLQGSEVVEKEPADRNHMTKKGQRRRTITFLRITVPSACASGLFGIGLLSLNDKNATGKTTMAANLHI